MMIPWFWRMWYCKRKEEFEGCGIGKV